jgi:hypothetical protein
VTDDGTSMPVYETVNFKNADGTTTEITRVAGEQQEVTNDEVEAEIIHMIQEVELVKSTANEATELSETLAK